VRNLPVLDVDVPTLRAQEDYFVYSDRLLAWTNYESRLRAGKLETNTLPKPNQMKPPALCI
jgi:hypothetical protein